MNINNSKFEITCVKPEQYPISDNPEIAFVGRSNVGKSSIINALLNRKSLARVGATPGKTREINFYNIDEKIFFVDLPGYGYASVSKQQKASWSKMIDAYLSPRQKKRLIIMLVDIRHTPSEDDKKMYEWIAAYSIPHLVVGTKCDKIPKSQIFMRLKDIKAALKVQEGIVTIPFSSQTKYGYDEIWNHVNAFIQS